MSLLVNIGILLCIVISIIVVVVIVILRYKEEELEKDNPIGINFLATNSEGRAIGVEKSIVVGKGDRRVITLSPRDVMTKGLKELKDVTVIVDKNKLLSLPKGVFSKDKNINLYLPPSIDKFPEPLKKTLFGKLLMFLTTITNAENAELDALQEGMKRQAAHIESLGMGELSKEKMTQLEEVYTDLLNAAKDIKKDKTGYTSPSGIPSYGS